MNNPEEYYLVQKKSLAGGCICLLQNIKDEAGKIALDGIIAFNKIKVIPKTDSVEAEFYNNNVLLFTLETDGRIGGGYGLTFTFDSGFKINRE